MPSRERPVWPESAVEAGARAAREAVARSVGEELPMASARHVARAVLSAVDAVPREKYDQRFRDWQLAASQADAAEAQARSYREALELIATSAGGHHGDAYAVQQAEIARAALGDTGEEGNRG